MPTCAVVGCESGSSRQNSCQAFSFPDGEKTRKEWLERINRQFYIVTRNSRVCIRHFAPEAFIDPKENVDERGRKRNKLRLKPLAFPTLEMKPSTEKKPPKRRLLQYWEIDHTYDKSHKLDLDEPVPKVAKVLKPISNDHSYSNKATKSSSNGSENVVAETIVEPAEIDDASVVLEDQQFDIDTMTVVVEEINAAKGIQFKICNIINYCIVVMVVCLWLLPLPLDRKS